MRNKSTKNGKNAKPILLGSLAPDLQCKNVHACALSFLPLGEFKLRLGLFN